MTTNTLIKKVSLVNKSPVIGEGVLVTVALSDPLAHVEINGVIGAGNYVQFETAGSHFINITASLGDVVEKISRKVVVADTPSNASVLPIIWSTQETYAPRFVAFSIANMLTSPTPAQHFEWDFGDGTNGISETGLIRHDYSDALVRDALHSTFHVSVKAILADGKSSTSMRTISVFNLYGYNKTINQVLCPRVVPLQNPTLAENSFVCTMTIQNLEDDELLINDETHEWLTTAQPTPASPSQASYGIFTVAPSSSNAVRAAGTVIRDTNTSRVIKLTRTIHSELVLNQAEILRIPAKATVTVARRFPKNSFTSEVFGVAVHLSGINVCSRLVVKCSGYFEVKLPMAYGGPVIHGNIIGALDRLKRFSGESTFTHAQITEAVRTNAAARNTTKPVAAINPQQIARMAIDQPVMAQRQSDRLAINQRANSNAVQPSRQTTAARTASGAGAHMSMPSLADVLFRDNAALVTDLNNPNFVPFLPLDQPIVIGGECDPDNLPDGLTEGTVCALTNELAWRYVPGRILNAKKGDILLSPGGQGLIGQLLQRVSPPQYYSHSGIMTLNHIEIRHSTGSEDYLKAHPAGSFAGKKGNDGFEANALKYLWPGTITQTIDHAYSGELLDGPDGKQYKIGTFTFDPSRGNTHTIAYPIVVKPQAFLETPQVRQKLHSIAEEAVKINGHYRFYCYTKPEIALDPKYIAGADSGWALNTLPTVCSSFIWLAAQHANIKLEGPAPIATVQELEVSDTLHGAEVADDTLDGLYYYTAEERQAAAQWLYQAIYDEAHDVAGFWGTLFADAPDNVANQVCNTFASDWVDGGSKDSDAWKSTGSANAVSPDNILFWDSPGAGNQQGFRSVYGSVEEAFFLPGTYAQVPIYRWKQVATRGNVTGRVIALPTPQGTTVSLSGSGQNDFIVNDDGTFRFDNVPAATYTITGGLDESGFWASDNQTVEVQPGQTTDVTLVLRLAPGVNRTINFTVHMTTTNYAFADKDAADFDLAGSVRVGPYLPGASTSLDGGNDNPHGHISFDVVLKPDLSVDVTWTAQEISDEVEAEIKHTVNIAKDTFISWANLIVANDDSIDADDTQMRFTISNDPAPA